MANCKEYLQEDHQTRYILIGKALHLFQNDSEAFKTICSLIRQAENDGKLDGVEILPDTTKTDY